MSEILYSAGQRKGKNKNAEEARKFGKLARDSVQVKGYEVRFGLVKAL